MKHLTRTGLAFFMSCLFAGSLLANPAHHKLEKMQKHLSLTEAQSLAVGDIFKANQPLTLEIFKSMQGLKQQMHQQLQADRIDEPAIKSLNMQIAEYKSQLMILHAKERKLVAEQLTGDQLEKMQKLQSKRQHRHMKNRTHDKHHDHDDDFPMPEL